MADDRMTPILQKILDCVAANLTNSVKRKVLMPGSAIVEDECCDGQVFVQLTSLVGASAMSIPAMQPCYSYYQTRVKIGVSRCISVINDAGQPPSPSQMYRDTQRSLQDFADIVQAINCCFAPQMEELGLGTLRIEGWLPSPGQGGCLTSEVNITFNYDACQPCAEEAT